MFTVIRRGDFYATPTGDNHCGLSKTAHRFLYEVAISCKTTDERGFVVDQFDVQKYFDNLWQVEFSCEQLAETVAHHFLSNLRECDAILVVISPTNRQEAEARFELSEARLPVWRTEHETGGDTRKMQPLTAHAKISHMGDF